jgi:hypothetical protein
MDKKGGQAFPRTGFHKEQDGMTLRDYFAAKAMQGLYLAEWPDVDMPGIAKAAYAMADAMLAERNK